MAYGILKVDTIIFDQGGADQNVTVSGIYKAITSGVTVSGTISGAVLVGTTTVSGATVTGTTVQGISGTFTTLTGTTTTGTTANFASGVFTTRVSGTTITGTTAQFTSGTFVSLTGTTITGTTISGTTVSSTTGTFTSLTGTTITGTTVNGTTVNSITGNFTTLTGTTTTGITVNFTSGVFTTQVSGATVTGTQSSFTSGNFVTLSGATATFTSGVIASGTAAAPSLSIISDPNTGIYSPGADQLAVATNGTGRLFVDATGNVGVGTASPTSFGAGAVMQSIVGTTSYGGYLGFTNNVTVQLWADESGLAGNMGTRTNHPLIVTTNNIEKLRITSAGLVGIGTSAPDSTLHVLAGAVAGLRIGFNGTSVNYYDADTQIFRNIAGTERARIDSSGRLLVGTSSASKNADRQAGTKLALVGVGDVLTSQVITGYTANSAYAAPLIDFQKSRGSSDGSMTIVAAGDYLGGVQFLGSDGTNFIRSVLILAEVDGTPGTNDMPGRLTFCTTADGAASPTERMRIDSSGNVGIGTSSPQNLLSTGSAAGGQLGFSIDWTGGGGPYQVAGLTADNSSGEIRHFAFTNYFPTFYSNNSERARIDSSGRLLVGTSTALLLGSSLSNFAINTETLVGGGVVNHNIGATRHGGTTPEAGPVICLARSRGTTLGAVTLVANGDTLGVLEFSGADGTDFGTTAATIRCEVDGTPGANDMPGRLVFSTTADGASSPTERMRITSSGNIITTGTFVDPAITGTILEDVFTITDAAAFEVDPGNGSIQLITLGASRTPKATNFTAGESITLMVNDGTAYTITWTDATWGTGGVIWKGGTAPTLASTGFSVIQFWKVSTQVYGVSVGSVA